MPKYNFIHFVTDEKFIKDEILCYENAHLTNNEYFHVGFHNKIFKFIDNKIVSVVTKTEALNLILSGKYSAVCLHNLYSLPLDILTIIPQRIKVIWYAWGFDLYSNPAPLYPLIDIGERYMEDTLRIVKNKSKKEHFKTFAKGIQCLILRYKQRQLAKEAISRIDYFAGVFPMEWDMIKNAVPYFKAEKITHNYIHPQEFGLKDIKKAPQISGKNILLGNSASMLGNHIDIMKQIVPYVELDTKVICPLSYAGTPKYIEEVIRQGKKYFGERFIPLIDYLPFDDYTKLMRSCNRFVIGMIQQAATCNCLTSLWEGIKIYAPKCSINYKQYNEMGIQFYSIEEDFGREADAQYSNLKHNRTIIEDKYSYRAWVRDLQKTLETIF